MSRLFATEHDALTSDDYYTPPWIFERLGLVFDLDPCAPRGGVPWIPAHKSLSIDDDGTTAPWHGRVWMNPPFSRPHAWVDRFIDHADGIALLPVTASRWFDRLWGAVDGIALLPRVVFVNGDRRGNPYRVILGAMGASNVDALATFGRVR